MPIGAGTDTPIGLGIPGYSLHTELELLVRSGLTPLEALHAATVQPARFFGLEAELGLIQPGMLADLMLLETNPLDEIENTRRIRRVMSGGRWAFTAEDDAASRSALVPGAGASPPVARAPGREGGVRGSAPARSAHSISPTSRARRSSSPRR